MQIQANFTAIAKSIFYDFYWLFLCLTSLALFLLLWLRLSFTISFRNERKRVYKIAWQSKRFRPHISRVNFHFILGLLARQPLEHYVQLHRVNKAIPHKPRRFRLCSCWTCPQDAVHVLDTLCLCSIRYACPQYAVPVLNTLCLSSIRCACSHPCRNSVHLKYTLYR